jgi:hypothetical protein
MRIAEPRDRLPPIGPVAVLGLFLTGDVFPVSDEAGAEPTGDDLTG